jgi:hypothetical protein
MGAAHMVRYSSVGQGKQYVHVICETHFNGVQQERRFARLESTCDKWIAERQAHIEPMMPDDITCCQATAMS